MATKGASTKNGDERVDARMNCMGCAPKASRVNVNCSFKQPTAHYRMVVCVPKCVTLG
jgi:hypothetical protein